jgi:hypothetical protein
MHNEPIVGGRPHGLAGSGENRRARILVFQGEEDAMGESKGPAAGGDRRSPDAGGRSDAAGALAYLCGPGRRNEHVNGSRGLYGHCSPRGFGFVAALAVGRFQRSMGRGLETASR